PSGTQLWQDGSNAVQQLGAKNGFVFASMVGLTRKIDGANGATVASENLFGSYVSSWDGHVYAYDGGARMGQNGAIYTKAKSTANWSNNAISIFSDSLQSMGTVVLNGTLGASRSYDEFDVDA